MNDLYSKPAYAQGIKFEYNNWEEVIQVIGLNNGTARGVYLTKDGNVAPQNTLTEHRGIMINNFYAGIMIASVGDWIMKFEDEKGVVFTPVPDTIVKDQYVLDPLDIGNGQHTFRELYEKQEELNTKIEYAYSLLKQCVGLLGHPAMEHSHATQEATTELREEIIKALDIYHPKMEVIKNDE